MSSKTELKNWIDRLTISDRKYDTIKDKIRIYKDYYRGKQWEGFDEGFLQNQHAVVDNIVFSNIRAIVPRLIARNPRIFVSPKKKPYKMDQNAIFDTVGASLVLEIALNYYFKELKTKREVRRCLYDALLGYWGIMELGYTVKTEKIYTKGSKDELLIIDELIKSEEIFVKRRSPTDFRVDVEGTDHLLNDSRWIGLRWVRSLDDIKNDDSLENKNKLKANHRVETDFNGTKIDDEIETFNQDPTIWDRVEGWTLWDKKLRRKYDVVKEHDKFLSNDKWPNWTDAIDGFPVEMLYINENPDEQFPLPDIEIYKKAQDEINLIGTMMLEHIDSISARRYAASNNVEQSELDKLLHNGRCIIQVDGDPSNKVWPIPSANISQDLYMQQRQKKVEAAEMAGVTQLEKGGARNFETATEPALLNAGSQSIRDDQRSLVEDFVVRIVQKQAGVLQQTLDSRISIPLAPDQFEGIGKVINTKTEGMEPTQAFLIQKIDKIVSREGALILQPWLNLSADDIKGEYDFNIEVGSTQPVNQEIRKRDTAQLAQFNFGNPAVDQREWTRKINESFDRKDVDEYLKPEEQMQQEQQQAMQAQMQAQQAEQQGKAQVDLTKTQMKTQSAEKINERKAEVVLLTEMLRGRK